MTLNKYQIKEFIGRHIEHAEKYVKNVRVVAEDGKRYMVTTDHWTDRLNVKLENGIIVEAYWG